MKNFVKAGFFICFWGLLFTLPCNAAGKKATYKILLIDQGKNVHGNVEFDKTAAADEETVTIIITPKEGYTVNSLSVSTKKEEIPFKEVVKDKKYIFTMPKKDVNVSVGFKQIPVTSVVLSDSSFKIYVGETKSLTATIEPENAFDKSVNWSSNNTDIAIVENGIVKALSKGNVIIKAECNGKYSDCNVTVRLPMVKPTDKVVYLPAGTNGTVGPEGSYVLFGDWPQTIKDDDVVIDESITQEHGGFIYYAGDDGNWYVKCKEVFGFDSRGYGENDKYYQDNMYSNGSWSVFRYLKGKIEYWEGKLTVQNSKLIRTDELTWKTELTEKYFKVEPIKWRILNPNAKGNEKKILLSEKILTGNIDYYGYKGWGARITPSPANYSLSNIRSYLNSLPQNNTERLDSEGNKIKEADTNIDWSGKGFLANAFTSSAQKLIAVTEVNNSYDYTIPSLLKPASDDYNLKQTMDNKSYGKTTKDKIFLLSLSELCKSEYGFTDLKQPWDSDSFKSRIGTDYSIANHAGGTTHSFSKQKNGEEKSSVIITPSWWITRSPAPESPGEVFVVSSTGEINTSRKTTNSDYGVVIPFSYGIVPALCLE